MTINYKGQEIKVLPAIKRYVNAISRRLSLPFNIKARVMSDLSTSICARHEAGESYEDIMESLGTPAEVAAELNKQMSEYAFRKSPWRFVMLSIAVLSALWLILYFSFFNAAALSVAAIGGADGPTAIFLSAEASEGAVYIYAAILLVSIFGFFKLSRMKKKK